MTRKGVRVRMRRFALAAAVMMTAAALAGCGYALAGRGSYLPASIKTIGIPLFLNRTSVFNVEQVLTERVRQEFIGRGKYAVTPQEAGADAVLNGEIMSIEVAPSAFNEQQQATRYKARLTVKLELQDVQAKRPLWEDPARVFEEEYDLTTGGNVQDAGAFLGSDRTALDRLAADFARSTVSAILEAF
jgi:hypothetical protein